MVHVHKCKVSAKETHVQIKQTLVLTVVLPQSCNIRVDDGNLAFPEPVGFIMYPSSKEAVENVWKREALSKS